MNRRGFLELLFGGLAVATAMGVPALFIQPVKNKLEKFEVQWTTINLEINGDTWEIEWNQDAQKVTKFTINGKQVEPKHTLAS